MENTRALCILTTVLGNKAMTRSLQTALSHMPRLQVTSVLLEPGDYRTFPAPWWARATDPWQAQYMAREKARSVGHERFDLLLVNSWEFVVAFRHLARKLPAAAVLDVVPATMDFQLRRRGIGGWRRWLPHQVHHRAFARAARAFDVFLPLGSDCAASLERDYRVDSNRCFVTLAPQDLESWAPATPAAEPRLRLLFVANDFARKGGDFLLDLYAARLADISTLTIASNDPALSGRNLPPGVQWVRGRSREQLLEVYRSSDLFVFPTRQDFLPQALAEALAVGVPCLATDVGGIPDLVRDGETGFLVPYDSPAEYWAAHIRRLAADRVELVRLSAGARSFAEERLGFDRFERLLGNVIDRLVALARDPGQAPKAR